MSTKLTNEVLLLIQGELARFDRDGNDSAARPTWETVRVLLADRERLLNLVRYCRHELFDKDLITQEEFASLLEEGSAAKLETYDGLRARIAALESELKAAEDLAYMGEHHFPDATWKARCMETVEELKSAQNELSKAARLINCAGPLDYRVQMMKLDYSGQITKLEEELKAAHGEIKRLRGLMSGMSLPLGE